ncbi:OppA family ABC transporter substrate-binding lipoprotein [Mycoplasma sp. 613B]
MKKRKLLIGFSVPAVLIGTSATVVSCSTIEPHYKRQEISSIVNLATSGYKKFDQDFSVVLGSPSTPASYFTTANLFATVSSGQAEFENVKPNNGNKFEEGVYKIKKPTYQWYSLILVDKIYVTDLDGTISVFDNDKHEKGMFNEGEEITSALVKLTSDDPKSINSLNFLNKLSKASKIQLTIKKDIPWVKSNGQKSQYNVELEDFVYGWNRKMLYGGDYRASHGGSKKIDDDIIRKYSLGSSSSFDSTNHVSNDYLFKVFGIQKDNFSKSETFITDIKDTNEKGLTFLKIENKEANFNELFKKLLLDSTYFSPVSHKFIDDRNKQIFDITGKHEGEFGETGDAFKYAYYWYGKQYDEDQLYASPYLPFYLSNDRTVYIRNDYYAETGWKEKEATSVKKITSRYNLYPDSVQFNSAQFNNYLEGTVSILPYSSLSDANKSIIYKDLSQIHFRKTPDKGLYKGGLSKDVIPGARDLLEKGTNFNGGQADKKYYFNDNYAKLAFGSSIEELAKGKAELGKTLFTGKSFAFRTIIDALWNSYTYIKDNSKTAIPWLSMIGPDNHLGGSELDGKTARDFYDDINTTFSINESGEIFYTKTIEEQRKQYLDNLQDKNKQYEAPRIEVLKAELKKILDDFYAENHLDASKDKIEFSISNRYRNESSSKIASLDSVIDMMNKLDNRLKINSQAEFKSEDVWNVLILGLGNSQIVGWSADYDGSGTFIDGSGQLNGSPLYLAIAHFAELPSDSPYVKSFPEFKKYADAFKTEFEKERLAYPDKKQAWLPFSEWIKATNAYDANYEDIQYEYEYEKNADGTPKEVDKDGNAVPKLNDKKEKVYVFTGEGLNKKPVWSQKYKWVLNKTTNKYEKKFEPRKASGKNSVINFISNVTFYDQTTKKYFKDQTLEQEFEENGKKVKKVFNHSLNKWVDASAENEFNELTAIFNLNYESKATNKEIVELAKEIRVLIGYVPEIDLSTSSNVPSISIWNKHIEIPLSEFEYIPYGDVVIRKGDK